MTDDRTVRQDMAGQPVRDLRVEIVTGPQAGAAAETAEGSIGIGTAEGNDLRIDGDRMVSRYHLEISRAGDRIALVDLESTNGTSVGDVRLRGSRVTVSSGATVRVGQTDLRVVDGSTRLVPAASDRQRFGSLFGRSEAMLRVMDRVEQLAQKDVSVLIVGESGTGKEVTARTLHEEGSRRDSPFVTVDCGAVSPNLFESTLFGHEKGSFTGAERQHQGAFERAGNGTLFLDEIGELLPEQQVALLGVLERRQFVRVGGRAPLPFGGRVVAATNRDLRAEVNSGAFRLDLYYRLAVVTIALPPLRERPEDIPTLMERFMREEGSDKSLKEVFAGNSLRALMKHGWPGNARELRNVVSGTLAIGEVPELLPPPPAAGAAPHPHASYFGLPYKDARATLTQRFEREYIEHLLRAADENVARAARMGQMNRSYLIDLLKKHGFR